MMRISWGLATSLAGIIAIAAMIFFLNFSHQDEADLNRELIPQTNFNITISNMSVEVKLKVPVRHLGPRFLSLTNEVLTETQVDALPLMLKATDFGIPAASQNVGSDGRLFILLYPTLNGSISRILETKVGTAWGYIPTNQVVFGLKKYVVQSNIETNIDPYYYSDPEDPNLDVLIRCSKLICRYLFNSSKNINLQVNDVPVQQLGQWKSLVSRLRVFADSLVVSTKLRKAK